LSGILIRDCRVGGTPCSVLVKDGRIAEVGDVASLPASVEVVEANGGALYPGFIDSHCHPFELGWLKRSVDLRGTTNTAALRLRVAAGVQRAKPGEWVTGMGWDQEYFPGRQMPTRQDLDDISPANPVALSRVCGHIALLNAMAVEELGFADRKGVEYPRDPAGSLTGIVKETALTEVFRRIPRSSERSAADLQSVEAEASRLGLTALHCIVSPEGFEEELAALASLEASGSLALRYRVYVPPEALPSLEEKGWRARLQGERVRICGVKVYSDGSLGARTAALREPYADDPANNGLLRYSDEALGDLVEKVDRLGFQAIIHAIGDRAVEQAVGALERVAGSGNPRRHRIEHASLLPGDLLGRMARHGVRASVQPLFVTSDSWAVERLGEERVRDLYPFRSMLEAGIVASGSSDSPVESMSPVLGMWASMTRGGSSQGECLDLERAISLYTSNAASNGFDDGEARVEVGSRANLTLLDSATEGLHPALFRKVGVLATVVEGSVVHSYGGA